MKYYMLLFKLSDLLQEHRHTAHELKVIACPLSAITKVCVLMVHRRRNFRVEAEVAFCYGVGVQFSVTDTHNLHDFPFNSPDLRQSLK